DLWLIFSLKLPPPIDQNLTMIDDHRTPKSDDQRSKVHQISPEFTKFAHNSYFFMLFQNSLLPISDRHRGVSSPTSFFSVCFSDQFLIIYLSSELY
ncbi:hypothetical protein HAX54_036341, partial [Datura stramonium]|nr:hypothetical protein [Datura stramonium]